MKASLIMMIINKHQISHMLAIKIQGMYCTLNINIRKRPYFFKHSICNDRSLPNRCNSMIALNGATEQSIHFPTRGKQSVTECLYDETLSNQNDLWRTNSLVNVNRSPTAQISVQPKPFASETASKFGHHRLW